MKRIKLGLKILILLTAIMIPLKSVIMVKADSGWDSSFGGGSSFGGSSWSSSSSSWGGSSSSGGGSSCSTPEECKRDMIGGFIFGTLFISIHYFFFFQQPFASYISKGDKKKYKRIVTALVILRLVVMIALEIIFPMAFLIDFFGLFLLAFIGTPIFQAKSSKYRKNSSSNTNNYYDVSDDELHKYLPNEELSPLKEKLYDVFTDVQIAWMNFEYDRLKQLCGDELATTYIQQLESLKLKHGQNKMSDFDLQSIVINSIKQNNDIVEIGVILKVSFYDYVIDTNTNKVTRGSKNSKLTNTYSLVYTRGINDKVKCPKCGGILDANKADVCPYCRTKLNVVGTNYKLSKKGRI